MGARGWTASCYGATGVLNALWGATLPVLAVLVAAAAPAVLKQYLTTEKSLQRSTP